MSLLQKAFHCFYACQSTVIDVLLYSSSETRSYRATQPLWPCMCEGHSPTITRAYLVVWQNGRGCRKIGSMLQMPSTTSPLPKMRITLRNYCLPTDVIKWSVCLPKPNVVLCELWQVDIVFYQPCHIQECSTAIATNLPYFLQKSRPPTRSTQH